MTSVLVRRNTGMDPKSRKIMSAVSGKTTECEPKGAALQETNPTDVLTSDFQIPELKNNK